MRPEEAATRGPPSSRAHRVRSLDPFEIEAVDAAPDDALDHHPKAIQRERFSGAGHAAESLEDESSHGRDVLVLEVLAERFGELIERHAPGHPEARVRFGHDRRLLP